MITLLVMVISPPASSQQPPASRAARGGWLHQQLEGPERKDGLGITGGGATGIRGIQREM